jgi:hypothetical protein
MGIGESRSVRHDGRLRGLQEDKEIGVGMLGYASWARLTRTPTGRSVHDVAAALMPRLVAICGRDESAVAGGGRYGYEIRRTETAVRDDRIQLFDNGGPTTCTRRRPSPPRNRQARDLRKLSAAPPMRAMNLAAGEDRRQAHVRVQLPIRRGEARPRDARGGRAGPVYHFRSSYLQNGSPTPSFQWSGG